MHVDIAKVLHVLAHELRTPAGIAQGYLRMLLEDRLTDPQDRRRALEQTQKALTRVSELTHEGTRLANWMESAHPNVSSIDARSLVTRAVELAAVTPEPSLHVDTSTETARVTTGDADALVHAVSALVKATARELRLKTCAIDARLNGGGMLDVLIAPSDQMETIAAGPEAANAGPLSLERGGLGLALVMAAVVLTAHGAIGWTANGSRTTVGIRLPLEERALQ